MSRSPPPDDIGPKIGDDGERDSLDIGSGRRKIAAHIRGIGFRRRLRPLCVVGAGDGNKPAHQLIDGIGRFVGIVDQQVSDQRPQDGLRGDEVDLQFGYGPVALLFGACGGHDDDLPPYVLDGWLASACAEVSQ